MKKKIISVIAIMTLVFGICTVAMADGTTAADATRNSLKSSGNVVYTDGENSVEIYSEDLYMIADRLDLFKNAIADQLAAQDTYFTSADKGIELTSNSNVNIVHTAPSESDAVEPLTLDFDSILEGIAASQSIPSDVSEYGYPEGTTLYKNKSGELTTDRTEENVEQINIAAAEPENLSAGSAAWVNGELILGTGADNNAYYNQSESDVVLNVIDVVYSGITKDEPYTVSDYIGNGFSSSVSITNYHGTKEGKRIGIRSDHIPVWDLDSSEKKLLNKIVIQRSGSSSASTTASRGSKTKYRVYTEDGVLIKDGTTNGVGNISIDVMTLPISTQYIYVECESKPSVTGYESNSDANCSVTYQDTLLATYLVNQ